MKQKYDVICIGDVVMDAFIGLKEAKVEWDKAHEHPELEMPFADKIPYESLTVAPAVGNASNVAVGAARLGLNTAIVTAVGGDHYGTEILDRYHKEGVSTEYVKVNKSKPTNYHFVLTLKRSARSLSSIRYMNISIRAGWIPRPAGSISLPSRSTRSRSIKKLRNI